MSKIAEIDIYGQLAAEQTKRRVIAETEGALKQRLSELQRAWWETRNNRPSTLLQESEIAARQEAVQAIVDDRAPDPAIMASAEGLEIQMAACQKKLIVVCAARSQQTRIVNGLLEKIEVSELPAKLARLQPRAKELRTAFDALVELNAEYQASCRAEGASIDPFPDIAGDARDSAHMALRQIARFTGLLGGLRKVTAA